MQNVIGTCGNCGGQVCTPRTWLGVTPPTPTCNQCGAVPKAKGGPVIEMEQPGGPSGPRLLKE